MSFWIFSFIYLGCGKALHNQNNDTTPPEVNQKPEVPPSPSPPLQPAENPDYTFQIPDAVEKLPDTMKQQWPPENWVSAKAYAFNMVPYQPRVDLYIYKDGKWNDKITTTKEISKEQATAAIDLVHRTAGDVKISKCPFPRHGVVLFDDKQNPVASINVCFQCGDILVWPPYLEPDSDQKKYDSNSGPPPIIPVYYETFPIWEEYFYNWLKLTKDPYYEE